MQSTHASSRHASCSITPQRTHDLTHKHRSTPQSHGSRMLTSLPGLKSKSRITRLTANFAGRTKPISGLARCETAHNPPREHTHASRTPLTQRAWAHCGGEQKEAHLGFLLSLVATPFRCSRRFRQSAANWGCSHSNLFLLDFFCNQTIEPKRFYSSVAGEQESECMHVRCE